LIPGTRELAGPDIVAQTRQVLLNLQAILEAAGSDLAHAIKTTVFLADMKDWPAMNEVYGEFFPSQPPSRSAIQVVALPLGAKVEIEAVAVVCDAGC
ncbi:MAG TPA: Rid family hydrolase, partial [Anaerolineae bacterium]|nr:Rid family hydrolase [Anaerolineae bacterium]